MSTDDEQHLTPLAQHVVFVYCFVCGLFCLTELLFYVCCLFLGEVSCFVYVIEKLYCSLPLHLIRAAFAGDLQSLSWLAMAFGGVCGSLLGGYALTNIEIDRIFLLFTVLPAIQLLSCGLVKENRVSTKVLIEFSSSNGYHQVNGNESILDDEDGFSEEKYNFSTKKRKKNKKNQRKRVFKIRKSQIPEKSNPLVIQWFHSLKAAIYSLYSAFRQPEILR